MYSLILSVSSIQKNKTKQNNPKKIPKQQQQQQHPPQNKKKDNKLKTKPNKTLQYSWGKKENGHYNLTCLLCSLNEAELSSRIIISVGQGMTSLNPRSTEGWFNSFFNKCLHTREHHTSRVTHFQHSRPPNNPGTYIE